MCKDSEYIYISTKYHFLFNFFKLFSICLYVLLISCLLFSVPHMTLKIIRSSWWYNLTTHDIGDIIVNHIYYSLKKMKKTSKGVNV